MTDSLEGFLNGGGDPSASFKEVGTVVKGTVTAAELSQQTDFETGKPKTWEDGNPMMQIVVSLQTDLRDPAVDDDEGKRRIFVKGQMLKALRDAVKAASVKTVEVGGTLAVKYTGDAAPTRPGLNGAKQYVVQYRVPEPAVDAPGLGADELL